MGEFVSVSRSFWKESQGAPSSLPSHMGTEYGWQGRWPRPLGSPSPKAPWFLWPGPAPPGPALPELAPKGQTKEPLLSRKGGSSASALTPGLREFALLPASLWKFAFPAPAEAPAPPQPSLATWPTELGPLLAPSVRLLKETAAPCFCQYNYPENSLRGPDLQAWGRGWGPPLILKN